MLEFWQEGSLKLNPVGVLLSISSPTPLSLEGRIRVQLHICIYFWTDIQSTSYFFFQNPVCTFILHYGCAE